MVPPLGADDNGGVGMEALLARMDARRAVDCERWCVDGTSIRALHAAAICLTLATTYAAKQFSQTT